MTHRRRHRVLRTLIDLCRQRRMQSSWLYVLSLSVLLLEASGFLASTLLRSVDLRKDHRAHSTSNLKVESDRKITDPVNCAILLLDVCVYNSCYSRDTGCSVRWSFLFHGLYCQELQPQNESWTLKSPTSSTCLASCEIMFNRPR